MNLRDPLDQRRVRDGARRPPSASPRVVPAGGDIQQSAHRGHGVCGLVLLHELESFGGTELVSRANQAAAFDKISRSIFSCRFSRRSRRNSSRSAVVNPSALRPSSRSAWWTQFRIACADGSNSLASSSGVRPARTSSTICRRNSAGYGGLDRGISSSPRAAELWKTGPLPRFHTASAASTTTSFSSLVCQCPLKRGRSKGD